MSLPDNEIADRLETAIEQLKIALLLEVRTLKRSSLPSPQRGHEYLSVRDLCERIPYAEQTIRNKMSTGELKLDVHYFKPAGRVLFHWAAMEEWVRTSRMEKETVEPFIPEHHGRPRKEQ